MYMFRTIKHWWRKLKMAQRNGKLSHALGLEKLILLKWPYYPKQSTELMWPLSNYPWHFHRIRTNDPKIYVETKDPELPKQYWGKRTKLEA